MSRNLEDTVRRGVDNPFPGTAVLGAKLVQNRGSRTCLVSQDTSASPPGKFFDYGRREALGIRGERLLEDKTADFPVTCRTILTWTGRLARSEGRLWFSSRSHSLEQGTTTQPERLQPGEP